MGRVRNVQLVGPRHLILIAFHVRNIVNVVMDISIHARLILGIREMPYRVNVYLVIMVIQMMNAFCVQKVHYVLVVLFELYRFIAVMAFNL